MNDQPFLPPPETPDEEAWEDTMHDTARYFAYPATPDIAGSVRVRLKLPTRRPVRAWRLGVAALVVLLVFSMAVPQVRAFVLEVLRIGAVRIFLAEPSATLAVTLTPSPTDSGQDAAPTPLTSVLDLTGETTLADAQARFGAPILRPAYPTDLGAPDHVYLQNLRGWVVSLVWIQPGDSAQVRLVLQILNRDAIGSKYYPWEDDNQQYTRVNNRQAIWLTDVHEIFYYLDDEQVSRVVDKNVLIWEQGDLTYRLETDLSLEEAVRIAESLQ